MATVRLFSEEGTNFHNYRLADHLEGL